MKKILFLLTSLCFLLSATAQKSITGTVSDENGEMLIGANVVVKNTIRGTITDLEGTYSITANEGEVLEITYTGYDSKEIKIGKENIYHVVMTEGVMLQSVVVTGYGTRRSQRRERRRRNKSKSTMKLRGAIAGVQVGGSHPNIRIRGIKNHHTESYKGIVENEFRKAKKTPLSTFSIDVDRAAYSNVRRFLNRNSLPQKDAVRTEELINYFHYDYPEISKEHPFSVHTEISKCPWNKAHHLVHIGLQGKKMDLAKAPKSNLVFLIDVSGSMNSEHKLTLVLESMKILVNNLREDDYVSIVVYAGAAGLVLPPTNGSDKTKILEALNALQAGGSTAGGAGIQLAYDTAKKHFLPKGNNRVILATDGDFNIGISSEGALQRLIEKERKSGIFLSVLGFGMGNYKDSMLETLADKGNGNYAYIDTKKEAFKIFSTEFGGTLFTIAKDVKFQLEFNPKLVDSYRLVGYENRLLNDEDFNDDKKDAGDMGAGHSVTALYEVVLKKDKKIKERSIDKLRYQKEGNLKTKKQLEEELLFIKLRYKSPKGSKSKLMQQALRNKIIALDKTSDDFRFSAAVAAWSLLLRDSKFKGESSFDKIQNLAEGALGKDEQGYRKEFLELVLKSKQLADKSTSSKDEQD